MQVPATTSPTVPTQTETRRSLRRALPERERRAVFAWLSTFFPYQIAWILDFGRFSLLLKARQIGASHAYAAAAALWSLFGETTTVVSVGEREALEVLDKAERHLTVLAQLGSTWARPAGTRYRSGESVRCSSGGRILALPSSSGGRGFSGNVILDEFGYHQDPEKLWDGASAVVMHSGRFRVLSTPNGVGNLFHKLCTEPAMHAGYSRHRTTLEEAMADGLRVDLEACWKMARHDPRVFDQLFRCSFLDADEQYIPTELVRECSVADTGQPRGAVFAGLDVGIKNDLSALCILRLVPETRPLPDGRAGQVSVRWVQDVVAWKRTSWEAQEKAIDGLFRTWPIQRLCIDATGMGIVPAERLVSKYGARVEPVSFTSAVKEELATQLYTHFNERIIRLPVSNALLRDDVCSLRRLVSAAGNVRYDAARTSDGHADRAWALALALHACSRPVQRYDLRALPNQ